MTMSPASCLALQAIIPCIGSSGPPGRESGTPASQLSSVCTDIPSAKRPPRLELLGAHRSIIGATTEHNRSTTEKNRTLGIGATTEYNRLSSQHNWRVPCCQSVPGWCQLWSAMNMDCRVVEVSLSGRLEGGPQTTVHCMGHVQHMTMTNDHSHSHPPRFILHLCRVP